MAKEDDKKEVSTEDKALAIGKDIGVEPDKEEVVPDYDVTEDKGEETKEVVADERLGKTREEREDKHKLSNREKRQLRKKRVAERFDAKDALIRRQQEMINELGGRLNEVDGRLSQVDQAQLQQAWNETSAVFQQAEQEHAAAFTKQDGTAATLAMRKMYEAQKRLDELQAINARNQARQPFQQTQLQQTQPNDPVMVSKATAWAARNTWFNPKGDDDDSAIANTIAVKLVKEGFDAKSDDFYEELDDRLAAKGIGSDEDDEPTPKKEPTRRSPPVSGSGGRGDLGNGKVAITLPTAYINALKDAGKWDQKDVRDRMIKRYIDGVRERENESR